MKFKIGDKLVSKYFNLKHNYYYWQIVRICGKEVHLKSHQGCEGLLFLKDLEDWKILENEKEDKDKYNHPLTKIFV